VFEDLTLSNIALYVPDESLAKYQEAEVWKEFNIIPMSQKTGINNLPSDEAVIVGYYSLTGAKLQQEPQRGLYIIVYSNGKTEKVLKK
jgi:hypothetical protein